MTNKNPHITVDAVITHEDTILLIKRKHYPFKDRWALPGGFVEYGETCEKAVQREILEETGIEMKITGLIGVYSDPNRDPRGHTISIVYRGESHTVELIAGDDAAEAKFFKVHQLPELAFDHAQIIKDAFMREM